MFKRQIDVVLIKANGEATVVVNHKDYPNTFMCSGTFERFSGTESDKAVITIYNLPAIIRGEIALREYVGICVKYSYADETNWPSDLFVGQIVRQFNKSADEVTDATVIIALDTGNFSSFGFFKNSYTNDTNLYQIIDDLLREAKDNGQLDSYEISEKLKEYKTQVSKSYYGASENILQEITKENSLMYTKTKNSVSINTIEDVLDTNKTVTVFAAFDENTGRIESRSGLIGFPELTDSGITINCLVNTNIGINSLVQIDNGIININKSQSTISNTEFGANIDPDGLYIVTKIDGTFSNDGRENSMTLQCYSRKAVYDLFCPGLIEEIFGEVDGQ